MKPRSLSPEEKEEAEIKKEQDKLAKLLNGSDYSQEEEGLESLVKKIPVEFIYKPYVLDIRDVDGFYPLDDEHTAIMSTIHGELAVKMPYETWKGTYEYLSSENIKTIKTYDPKKAPLRRLKKDKE